jgi:hypothetical protein
MAAYHLEEKVQMWYQLFRDSEETVTWELLKATLHIRYGPTVFEDHFGNLTKLQQVGTIVKDYQLQFEQLLIQVGKLSIPYQLGCFVSGLKRDLRIEVQALKPSTLTKAIELARLHEACNQGTQNLFGINIKKPDLPPLLSSTLNRPQELVVKRLSLMELQVRCDHGLCFNCDERLIIPGHHCKKLFLLEGIYPKEDEPEEDHHGRQENTIAPLEFC